MPENLPQNSLYQAVKRRRAVKAVTIGSDVLTGLEAAHVREVRCHAKKCGLAFCVTVLEEYRNGRRVLRSVKAEALPQPLKPKAQRSICGAQCRDGHGCRAKQSSARMDAWRSVAECTAGFPQVPEPKQGAQPLPKATSGGRCKNARLKRWAFLMISIKKLHDESAKSVKGGHHGRNGKRATLWFQAL